MASCMRGHIIRYFPQSGAGGGAWVPVLAGILKLGRLGGGLSRAVF
jgi:hypothetical protein